MPRLPAALPPKRVNMPGKDFPAGQTMILAMAKVSEASAICFIMPFINQMVASFSPTSGNTARYAGFIESALIITEAICAPFWGAMADIYGRKPLMVVGLFAFAIASVAIGMSTSLTGAIVARSISGILGAVSVLVRTVQFEITTDEHIGRVLEFMTPCWPIGAAVGPMIGGLLAEPAKTMPTLFAGTIFEQLPYLLPSAVAALLPAATAVAAFFWLPETLGRPTAQTQADAPDSVGTSSSPTLPRTPPDESTPLLYRRNTYDFYDTISTGSSCSRDSCSCDGGCSLDSVSTTDSERQNALMSASATSSATVGEGSASYRDLIADPTLLYGLFCSAALSFVSMAYNAGFIMMASTPLSQGGLGLEPWHIGIMLGLSSIIGVIVATYGTPIFTHRLGWYRSLRLTSLAHVCVFPLIALTSIVAGWEGGVGLWSCCLLFCVLVGYEIGEISFTGVDVAIADRSPRGCLGAVNGLSLSAASLGRMIAPILSGQLWSISVESTLPGGQYLIWIVFTLVAIVWWLLTVNLTDIRRADPGATSKINAWNRKRLDLDLESGRGGRVGEFERMVRGLQENEPNGGPSNGRARRGTDSTKPRYSEGPFATNLRISCGVKVPNTIWEEEAEAED